jgi:hypothetical protein
MIILDEVNKNLQSLQPAAKRQAKAQKKGKRPVSAKPEAKIVKLVARRPYDAIELRAHVAGTRKSVTDIWTTASKL